MTREALAVSILLLPCAWGQHRRPPLTCQSSADSFCQVQTMTLPATSNLTVSDENGDVSIRVWEQPEIRVRAEVRASAANDALAAEIASQVVVTIVAGEVSVKGPSKVNWSVGLEIDVPPDTELAPATVNGNIMILGAKASIAFDTVNGEVSIEDVMGDISGRAVNGTIFLGVGGSHWAGQTVDVDTVNGSIDVTVPADCSALVTASVANGTITTNFPVEFAADAHRVSFDLGNSGSITLAATNGNIALRSE